MVEVKPYSETELADIRSWAGKDEGAFRQHMAGNATLEERMIATVDQLRDRAEKAEAERDRMREALEDIRGCKTAVCMRCEAAASKVLGKDGTP